MFENNRISILELIYIFLIFVDIVLTYLTRQSGLMACVRNSKINMGEAESRVLELLKKHTLPKGCPLTGYSVHLYQPFLVAYMPRVANYLFPYSIVDVGTVSTLSWNWCYHDVCNYESKDKTSRSLDDLIEDIKELKHFRVNVFRSRGEDAVQTLRTFRMMKRLTPNSCVWQPLGK